MFDRDHGNIQLMVNFQRFGIGRSENAPETRAQLGLKFI